MSAYSGEISVGVIGAGGMGARHADNLSTRVMGARVTGVTDVDRPRAEELAARCGSDTDVFESEQALIRNDAIDAIVIASPDDTHADLVLECLRNEKPVLCEKPLVTSAEGASKIVDTEAKLGRKLVQVGFMRHYDPQHLDAKKALDSGAFGRPVLFKGTHRNLAAAPGATSESILFNSAVHDLDCARWMLGQEIEGAYVSGAATRGNPGDDVLYLQTIHLKLSGDCLASIEVYVDAAYGYEVEVEVVGDAGTVHTAPSSTPTVCSQRHARRSVEGHWLERFPVAYIQESQGWIDSLHGGQTTEPDAWDGYTSLVAVEACVRSVYTGSPQLIEPSPRPTLYERFKEVMS